MTDQEVVRERAQRALDCCFDAFERLDSSGAAGAKWGSAVIALLTAVTNAANQRRYGRAVLEAPFANGLPISHKPIEADFVGSVK